jgi:hypothetical protein
MLNIGDRHGDQEAWAKVEWTQVQSRREQERQECDASSEARNPSSREEGAWRQGEEPEAGDRDRALGGAQEGREGAEAPQLVTQTQLVAPAQLVPEAELVAQEQELVSRGRA